MKQTGVVVQTVREDFPGVQAIYLFGSCGTVDEWPDSDVDVAILLPPEQSKNLSLREIADTRAKLSARLNKEVDLLNLRRVSTVFQKEVIIADRRIYTGEEYAAEEFEMLTLSLYQKLNEERREILAEGLHSGSFYKL